MKYKEKEFVAGQISIAVALDSMKSQLWESNSLIGSMPEFEFNGKSDIIKLNDMLTEIVIILNEELFNLESIATTIKTTQIGFARAYENEIKDYKVDGEAYDFQEVYLDSDEMRDYLINYFDSHKEELTEEQNLIFQQLLYEEAKEASDEAYANASWLDKTAACMINGFVAIGTGYLGFWEATFNTGAQIVLAGGELLSPSNYDWFDGSLIEEMIANDLSSAYTYGTSSAYSSGPILQDKEDLEEYLDSFTFYHESKTPEFMRFDDGVVHKGGAGFNTTKAVSTFATGIVASWGTGVDPSLINGYILGTGAKAQTTYKSAFEDGVMTDSEFATSFLQSNVKGCIDYGYMRFAGKVGEQAGKYVDSPIPQNYTQELLNKTLGPKGVSEITASVVRSTKPAVSASADSLLFGEPFDTEKVKTDTRAAFIAEMGNSAIKINLDLDASAQQAYANTANASKPDVLKYDLGKTNSDISYYSIINDLYTSNYLGKVLQKGVKEGTQNTVKSMEK